MNPILLTDSYKQNHWHQYPQGTTEVYSYFESRAGAEYPYTVFFGLQYYLNILESLVITKEAIDEAEQICALHFGDKTLFNRAGWEYILNNCEGRLPLEIKAVAEGTKVPTGNVLMTVRNTDENCFWLTNFVETLLTKVWYPSTVATRSAYIKDKILDIAKRVGTNFIDFHVHDFGDRGTTGIEASTLGGLAHLINFLGTDTMESLMQTVYPHPLTPILGYSVPASEHSVATADGPEGEEAYLDRMIDNYPRGIVSIVSDSYDIVRFVTEYIAARKDKIIARWERGQVMSDGKIDRIVIRPDSPRFKGDTAAAQCLWLHEELGKIFGYTLNENGYKVLHPCIGVIYGDGLNTDDIVDIYTTLADNGWAIDNQVVGQGGGLLQKLNRDTQRFAFKCSSQTRNGIRVNVQKNPLDKTKASKAGYLKLVKHVQSHGPAVWGTINQDYPLYNDMPDELHTVFLNGKVVKSYNFEDVRNNAKQPANPYV